MKCLSRSLTVSTLGASLAFLASGSIASDRSTECSRMADNAATSAAVYAEDSALNSAWDTCSGLGPLAAKACLDSARQSAQQIYYTTYSTVYSSAYAGCMAA